MTLSTPALLIEGSSNTAAAAYTTASVTPAADERVVLFVASSKSSAGALCPTGVTHGAMGALTKICDQAIGNTNVWLSAWTGVGTGTAGTFVVTHASAMGNCLWQGVTVASDLGTAIIWQSAVAAAVTAGTQGATLATTPDAAACVLAAYGYNNIATGQTAGSGYTLIGSRLTGSSPAVSMQSEYDATTPPAYASFGFSNSSGKTIAAIEVRDPAAAAAAWSLWDGTTEEPLTLDGTWDGTTIQTLDYDTVTT
ncbi:MAG: hypothetical protein QM714_02630 [Nocardioides sp.]|uniref:hypothetical protein n=1 Tax=Nocardioides sp. TaxID=35761 RepID=UPI0039E41DBA